LVKLLKLLKLINLEKEQYCLDSQIQSGGAFSIQEFYAHEVLNSWILKAA